MNGIVDILRDVYIRFLVWLGAEPPSGYKDLTGGETGPREYTLKDGDTLFSVARQFGVHYELIATANGIEDYKSVQAGQTLTIPPRDWTPDSDQLAEPEQKLESEPAQEPIIPATPLTSGELPEDAVPTETVPSETKTMPESEELDWLATDLVPDTDTEATAELLSATEKASVAEGVEELVKGKPLEADDTGSVLDKEIIPIEELLPDFEAELTSAETPATVKDEATPTLEADQDFRYEVQRGDTLSAIARRYGLTVKELVEASDIADPNRIFPGQKLIIPGYMSPKPHLEPEPSPTPRPVPDTGEHFIYPVASGDTLSAIAKRHSITLRELIEANDIEDPTLIHVGQKLIIPSVVISPEPMPPSEPEPAPEPIFEPSPPKKPTVAPSPAGGIDPNFPPIGPLDAVRALYVSYFAIGHAKFREHIFNLLDSTEFNAVVIDAKGDFGWISYPTQIALAREIGAARPTAKDFDALLTRFKDRGVYTIARIVTFKDSPLAKSYPELAVKTRTGEIWQDREEQSWSDPLLKPTWDYNIQIAIEAAQLGFDEIQFDYVRFPIPSQAGTPYFSQEVTKEIRVAAITGFLSAARGQLKPLSVKIAADTFGYTCWRKDDNIIGQDINRMGQYLDVLCPMLYPSTFGSGIPGYKFAIAHPYEVVYQSAVRAVNRLKPLDCVVRPWIQDFPDYRFDKRSYGKEEIQAQIKGSFDSGSTGFMVWDPHVKYTNGAYAPITEQP
jgi:LysM repeat protein